MEIKKYQFLLHTWGGFYNEEYQKIHKETPGYQFFDSMDDLQKELNRLRKIEKELNARCLAMNIYEGWDVHLKTIAELEFKYKDKIYSIEYDFGYGYPEESAMWMFTDGNYACDCNRSIFIKNKYPDFHEFGDCGHEIKLSNIKIVKR